MSATVRVTQPLTDIPFQWSGGSSGIRPRWGLSPNEPQNAAGIRIEPPPSEADAPPTSPAATAAALPPLEPPGLRSVFQGLRVAPQPFDSVKPQIASSGSVVLARITAPAARSRATISPSPAAGVVEGAGAELRNVALDVDDVLDRHRHPEQRRVLAGRAALVGRVGLGQRRARRRPR